MLIIMGLGWFLQDPLKIKLFGIKHCVVLLAVNWRQKVYFVSADTKLKD